MTTLTRNYAELTAMPDPELFEWREQARTHLEANKEDVALDALLKFTAAEVARRIAAAGGTRPAPARTCTQPRRRQRREGGLSAPRRPVDDRRNRGPHRLSDTRHPDTR